MDDLIEAILLAIGVIAITAIFFLVEGWIALALWNWIAVEVFSMPALNFGQMYGLIWLIHILFPSSSPRTKKE